MFHHRTGKAGILELLFLKSKSLSGAVMRPKLQIFGFSTEKLFTFLYLVKMPCEILVITLHIEKLSSSFNYNFPLYLMFLYPLGTKVTKKLRMDKGGNTQQIDS